MLARVHSESHTKDAPPVCLGRENPNRLVSLWDIVQEFKLLGLLRLVNNLDLMQARCLKLIQRDHGGVPMPDDHIEFARTLLPLDIRFCEQAEFNRTRELIEDFLLSLNNDDLRALPFPVENLDASTFAAEVAHMGEALHEELGARRYLYVRPDRVEYLKARPFGGKVAKAFPFAARDIREAGNCLAVEANDAAVFHLMRVAEYGLRAFAKDRRVKAPKGPLDLATWEEIIRRLENAETAIQSYPKTAARQAQFRFYHGAMMEFRGFKNKFRNGIMHTRDTYDRDEARSAFEHVSAFMRILASAISETKRTPIVWKGKKWSRMGL